MAEILKFRTASGYEMLAKSTQVIAAVTCSGFSPRSAAQFVDVGDYLATLTEGDARTPSAMHLERIISKEIVASEVDAAGTHA